MFSEDELHQARAVSVLEIAERHGAKLKRARPRARRPLPCLRRRRPVRDLAQRNNVWYCRGCSNGGDAIALEMHLSGSSFVDAVRTLIGQDAGTPTRRQPTPEEIAARLAREAERKRAEAEEQARKEMSAARIVARLQPVAGTPGETYLRDVRSIDVSHWAIRRALEDVETLGWCERIYFWQPDPKKPFHELNGQWLGAIVAILTDPDHRRAHRRNHPDLHPPGPQDRQGEVARRRGPAGDHPPVARRRGGDGLHLCEGIESALSA